MMLPNEILGIRFSKTGKDGYRMGEVDTFKSQVYESYNKLYTENNILNNRVSELNSLIQKYNSDKEAIASTLIYAQSTSDKTLSDARKKADEIIAEANEKAESEYADKIKAAEEKLQGLHDEYERTKAELERYSASYTENINAQAKEIIEKANAMAAKIVAEAKTEAEKVADENAVAVKNAKQELGNIGKVISKLKADALKVTENINSLTSDISESFDTASGNFDLSDISAEQINEDSIEPFAMPDFSEILAESIDINSGRPVSDDSISGQTKMKADEMNEYITRIFDSVGSDGAEFTSFKEGLTEALLNEIKSKGDVSFAREEAGEDSVEE
ncbi:MAG: DivIVA domain-containing protein [Clostridia bacterium]|nr:DivIVA domain-containing protein [Clostridia bacterium]